jgi:hypothetical protein
LGYHLAMAHNPDAKLDLQFDLERTFQVFAESLETRGIEPLEVAEALVRLSVNRVRMLRANAETDATISAARRNRAH